MYKSILPKCVNQNSGIVCNQNYIMEVSVCMKRIKSRTNDFKTEFLIDGTCRKGTFSEFVLSQKYSSCLTLAYCSSLYIYITEFLFQITLCANADAQDHF